MKVLLIKAKELINNFKSNPIDNLVIAFSFLSVAVALIGFVVAIVVFAVKGGYSEQVDTIKALGYFSGAQKAFTSGTVSIIYGNIVGTIIKVLFSSEIVLMLLAFLLREKRIKKNIMLVDLVFFAVLGIAYALYYALDTRKIVLTEAQGRALVNAFNKITINKIPLIIIVFAVLLIASSITFLILVLKSKYVWMIKYAFVSLIISFCLIPLVLLFIENIVPLVVGIIALAVIALILLIIMLIFIGPFSGTGKGDRFLVIDLKKGSYKIKDSDGNVFSENDLK